jgi:hypothetical protein
VNGGTAVVELPWGGTLTGHLAWLSWLGVYLALLNGSEEKVSTFVDWGWTLLTGRRGKRIIVSDEDAEAGREAPPKSSGIPGDVGAARR